MAKIRLNNAEFYYELHGMGEPLILIAGYACDHTLWLPLLDRLSQKFQVLLFDNRAAGQTKDNQQKLSAELMADDVMALADALKLKNPHIVGQSMGGTIAQSIGARYSDQIGKLVLLVSSAKWRQAMLLGLKSLILLREKGVDSETLFACTIPWIYGEKFLKNKKIIEELKNITLSAPFPQSLEDEKRQYEVLEKFDGIQQLSLIKSETLICCGTEDLFSLPYEAEFLASHIFNAKLAKINTAAHGMVEETSDQLVDILINFLETQSS